MTPKPPSPAIEPSALSYQRGPGWFCRRGLRRTVAATLLAFFAAAWPCSQLFFVYATLTADWIWDRTARGIYMQLLSDRGGLKVGGQILRAAYRRQPTGVAPLEW